MVFPVFIAPIVATFIEAASFVVAHMLTPLGAAEFAGDQDAGCHPATASPVRQKMLDTSANRPRGGSPQNGSAVLSTALFLLPNASPTRGATTSSGSRISAPFAGSPV